MFRKTASALGVGLVIGILSPVHAEDWQSKEPVRHLAYIPADSDAGSIHFESVKAVQIPTRTKVKTDPKYCAGAAFRDPGGSMYCSYAEDGPAIKAYEVTYSYTGEPLASDEYGARRSTFHVYFRPEELTPAVIQMLSGKKRTGAEAAAYFTVSMERQLIRGKMMDEARSHFCEGNFVDGAWMRSDAQCKDEVGYKAMDKLSSLLTVSIKPSTAILSAQR